MTVPSLASTRSLFTPAARANVILVLSVFSFGFTAIFARWAVAPGLVVAAGRVAVATVVLAVPYFRQPAESRRLAPAQRRRLLFSAGMFAVSLAVFHVALDFSTAANVTFLGTITPFWVGLLTLFVLRKALPRLFWPGLGVAAAGAALIVLGSGGLEGVRSGDLIMMVGTLFWAVYLVITEEARASVPALAWVWPVLALSALLLIGAALLLGVPLLGYGPQTVLALLASGVFSQALGFLGFNYALASVPAARASVTNMLKPVITAIAAALLLDEAFGGWRLVGGCLVMIGVYLVNRPDAPAESSET